METTGTLVETQGNILEELLGTGGITPTCAHRCTPTRGTPGFLAGETQAIDLRAAAKTANSSSPVKRAMATGT